MNRRRNSRMLILPGDRQWSATEWCNSWLERNLIYCIAVLIGVLIYLKLCCS